VRRLTLLSLAAVLCGGLAACNDPCRCPKQSGDGDVLAAADDSPDLVERRKRRRHPRPDQRPVDERLIPVNPDLGPPRW
jgi:hypothetical protein